VIALPPSPVLWTDDGQPRSRVFDDVYFSSADGLAESRAVFLAGCGLPDGWRGKSRFCVGELGFGSGLNVLALMALWGETREPDARLHVFSIEAFPMPASDARRALGRWPELAPLAGRLLAAWPRATPGFHRLSFDDLGVTLDLAVMDVEAALNAWSGCADAWFLDGFSPALNPGMWSQAVLDVLAARSAPGARAATFTVAGAVRRGLEAAGFAIEKRPGYGRKRERLEARLPEAKPEPEHPNPRVAVIGAGIAGAALARAFSALGATPVVFEAQTPGAGASGNPAALVMPRLDAGGGEVSRLYAQAFARAVDLYDQIPDAVIARGAAQAEVGPKDPSRFDRIHDSGLFAPDALTRLSPDALAQTISEPVAGGGLSFAEARVVEPQAVLNAWLAGADRRVASIARIEPDGALWRLFDDKDVVSDAFDIVCLANAVDAARLAPAAPLSPVRGQISVAVTDERATAGLWGGYVAPSRQGLVFGATHDRDETATDIRAQDHDRNLALLAQGRPGLAARLAGAPLSGRAAIRAVTPDFLPLAGPVEDAPGLYILSGLGSRGFCAAPLLAEHVAAQALAQPSPLPRDLIKIVHPGRFLQRRNRRSGVKGI
jgi:tRNA 5-methylaminomethyl-2-thiouridine biosynthesis bifunctional protein